MERKQKNTPLYTALTTFKRQSPLSFHVPGHKNGTVFPKDAQKIFQSILSIDMTELTGLDDLHAPRGVIGEAEQLAAEYFAADHTFFLVGGSSVGNLTMIMTACPAGGTIIVQRNSHKSILNGLELRGANPVFIAPEYDKAVNRFTAPSLHTLEEALQIYPDARAVVLTYPDYFGRTYNVGKMIELVHAYDIPVLVDEAHGVHFSLGNPFPSSSINLGADMVVQSAHKMAPAMTMASYLHINGKRLAKDRTEHYLQLLQSSSPSYPLLASLDIARFFLANLAPNDLKTVMSSTRKMRTIFAQSEGWDLVPLTAIDDPLKLTLQMKRGCTGFSVARLFEKNGVFPEMATDQHVLFIHGLQPLVNWKQLDDAVKRVGEQLKITEKHATIKIPTSIPNQLDTLRLSYSQMEVRQTTIVPYEQATGRIAAEAIIPYPPGIPFIMKGERITGEHSKQVKQLMLQGASFQHRDLTSGILVFTE